MLYRLNVLFVRVPPLRAREDDVILLARVFLRRLSAQYGGCSKTLHADAIARLKARSWPGNVRELENLVHREFLLSDDVELHFNTRDTAFDPPYPGENVDSGQPVVLTDIRFKEAKARAIAHFERAYISELLKRAEGNVSLAARLAGKERSRLGRLVRKYRLATKEFKSDTPHHTT